MLVSIVFLPFALMIVLWRNRIGDRRDLFLTASIIWGTFVIAITEILSRLNGISHDLLVAAWGVSTAVIVAATPLVPSVRQETKETLPLDSNYRFMLIGVGVIVGVSALVAWIGPPNNWDSMTYHLARVIHWIQNGNVAFYPAATPNQIELSPGAEYIILNLNSLSGSDRLANLVQWFAFVGCAVGVSSIARLLGADRRGQLLAIVYAATIPSACLEAVTTQNDLVAAFWLVCSIWLILRISKLSSNGPLRTRLFVFTLCGLSTGLALFTKATTYIYVAPFAIGLTGIAIAKFKWRAVALLSVVGTIALLLNGPLYARNYHLTHTFLGNPNSRLPYVNARIGVEATMSNVIRNTALEMVLPWKFSLDFDEQVARSIHRVLNIDAEEPQSIWTGMHFRLSHHMWNGEDNAGNPLHLLLLVTALATIPFITRRGNVQILLYAAGIVLGFIGFCAYLRFQVFHSRLLMPLMVVGSPFVAVVVQRTWNERVAVTTSILLIPAAMACIVANHLHPFTGRHGIFTSNRTSLYFLSRPRLEEPCRAIARLAAEVHCREVGLIIGGNDLEYALDVLIKQVDPSIRIELVPSAVRYDPKTLNRGWKNDLYPMLIVKVSGDSASVVEIINPLPDREKPVAAR